MATALSEQPKSALVSQVQRLKSGLSNMREAAIVATRRFTIVGIAAPTAYATGRLEGWAQRVGRNINLPRTNIRITLAGGIGAALLGAVGTKFMGETLSDAALGLGTGAIDGTLAVSGYRAGLTPPAPVGP